MSLRSERRGFRAAWGARLAGVCVVAVAALPFAAAPASAYVPCPDHDIEVGEINNWDTLWPTEGADAKGVTLCHGTGTLLSKVYLQIVDFRDGARAQLQAQVHTSPPISDQWHVHQTYTKRTVDEWYDFVRSSTDPRYNSPPRDLLFSTTNASYFKDSDNGNPDTKLPFGHMIDSEDFTVGVSQGNPSDPDHHLPKALLGFASVNHTDNQRVTVQPFPTYYSFFDLIGGYGDKTVALDPRYSFGGESRRTYVGFYDSKLYILTTDKEYTNEDTYAIMEAIQPGMSMIQLDGGGSTQFHSEYGDMDSNIPAFPWGDRKVPDVIAIYRAP